ncbi:LPS export ABC transporter periplasmic protein LptC [Winogradskyella poriferorum]|uniref:LPS export ABC transporter periplasmic protein LptC n=1 Tax=Winogradskyella poriferorum TaxID=307627 RepID=UPI003D64AA16
MNWKQLHIKLNLVTVLAVTLFFSCNNDFEEVQKVGVLQNQPVGEAENIDLKYTEVEEDSVKLMANLISPKMLDYSNRDFSFSEFPNGIELVVYGEGDKVTKIFADYAIVYNDTDIIDLRKNVVVATPTKDSLFTEQLYYNEKLEWIFTNQPFTLKRLVGPTRGNGFDSDKEFKNFQMLEVDAVFELDN